MALGKKVAKSRSVVVESRDQPLEKTMYQMETSQRTGEIQKKKLVTGRLETPPMAVKRAKKRWEERARQAARLAQVEAA
eukprot:5592364-Karenia_brevis.AAC.1